MIVYIIRRCLYAIPILIGVNVLVFMLFFFVNSPDDMARAHLGQKRVTPDQIDQWKREHSLDLPYFYNAGWQRIGSLAAKAKENTAEFATAGDGNYALIIEAPAAQKAAQERTLRLQSNQQDRLVLPDGFAEDGTITLPASTRSQRFPFHITTAQTAASAPPQLSLTFGLETPAPTHRVILEYQGNIDLLSRFTQTTFFNARCKCCSSGMANQTMGRISAKKSSNASVRASPSRFRFFCSA